MNQTNNPQSGSENKSISAYKKLVFNLILILIPFIIILFLELGLRAINFGVDLRLFEKSENYPGYFEINQDVNLRYFTKVNNTSTTNDIFLIEKPDTCFRIFVLGGSTTRGFPYQAATAFPRILYYRLQDAFPNKKIEVINLSASAINSYSYIDMLDEILDNEPDVLLVYGGHNEYYGALGVGSIENGGNVRWVKKLRLKFIHLRTFQLVQRMISKFNLAFNKNIADDATLMERIVKDKDIVYNTSIYQKGVKQFRDNITELVQKSKRKGVPIILSELVSNVNDQAPFKSDSSDENGSAIEFYSKAQKLEQEGKFEKSKELYYKAKDLDVIRFRAPEALNDVLKDICTNKQLPLIPMKAYFEEASPNNLIGNELILEHLHPTIDGYFLMADAFFKTLMENKFISDNWDTLSIKPADFYRNNWGFTELDSLIGELNILSLKSGWPFKPENELNHFMKSYKAEGYVDSMAFAYLSNTGDRHIEDEHIKLAQYYANMGLNNKAFEEYHSLIKLHPYIADMYYEAINYLIADHKYEEALNLINSAPLIDHNFRYYYLTGNLKLKLNAYSKAIPDLENAYKNITSEIEPEKVLIPLYEAYQSVGDEENKVRILKLIQVYQPKFGMETVKDGEKIIKISYKEIFDRAKLLMSIGNFDKAKELLHKTNKINETATANKLLAMVYIKQKQYSLAYDYCAKSYLLDPTDAENIINYFNLNMMKKDFELASSLLNELKYLNVENDKIQRLQRFYEKKKKESEMSNKN